MDDTYVPGILDLATLHKQNIARKNINWSDMTTKLVFAMIVYDRKAHLAPYGKKEEYWKNVTDAINSSENFRDFTKVDISNVRKAWKNIYDDTVKKLFDPRYNLSFFQISIEL